MKTTRRSNEGINHWNAPLVNKQIGLLHRFQEKSSAFMSGCGRYRYQLERVWDNSKPKVLFIMLNPSTADGTHNDPTIRRCISFAKFWGYGGINVGNLFALKSSDPKALLTDADPIGPDNFSHVNWMAYQCELIVYAWGNGNLIKRLDHAKFINRLNAIKVPKSFIELSFDGTPKHPLYLKGNLNPTKYGNIAP